MNATGTTWLKERATFNWDLESISSYLICSAFSLPLYKTINVISISYAVIPSLFCWNLNLTVAIVYILLMVHLMVLSQSLSSG
jgi:hypothetical protein